MGVVMDDITCRLLALATTQCMSRVSHSVAKSSVSQRSPNGKKSSEKILLPIHKYAYPHTAVNHACVRCVEECIIQLPSLSTELGQSNNIINDNNDIECLIMVCSYA